MHGGARARATDLRRTRTCGRPDEPPRSRSLPSCPVLCLTQTLMLAGRLVLVLRAQSAPGTAATASRRPVGRASLGTSLPVLRRLLKCWE